MITFKSIKSRTLSISFLPISILLLIATFILIDQYHKLNDLKQIQKLTEVIVQGNSLVHELQKERGRTSGFFNSKGVKFSQELTTQRSSSDKEIQTFFDKLNRIKTAEYTEAIDSDFEAIKGSLKELPSNRGNVDNFNGIVDDYLKYYTQTIGKILKITRDLNVLVKGNYLLGKNINSYYNLLQYKERIGITRATYAGVFTNNSFTKNLYKRAIEINIESSEYYKNYIYYSNEEQLNFYKNTVVGDDIDKTESFIKSAMENSESQSLNINPAEWFAAISGKIDKLKKVEEKQSNQLIEMTILYYQDALFYIIITLVVATLVIAFMIYYAIYHSNKIVKPIKLAAYFADEISKGNLINI